ncbi:MAG: cytochrome bc complex cytochrome b subunit [Candidatus Aminicenantales bacterium]
MQRWSQSLADYFEQRLKLSSLAAFAKKKTVPEHLYSFWYFFGGICLFLFILQVITGIFLLLYYKPSAEGAHESILFIMSQVKFGWLIRSVHSWSANLLIGIIFLHMFSTFFLKGYRQPRELTWLSGFFLLIIFMAFGFSGYLLPWNELSFFATKVGTNIVGSLPLVGKALKIFFLGGQEVSPATLSRFFWFHIAALPALAVLLLGLHIWLVQVLGMSIPRRVKLETVREEPFFPNFLLKDSLGWILVLVLIGVLCVFFPWEAGAKADPLAPAPVGIKPEWYFIFMFSTLKLIPSHVFSLSGEVLGILAFMVGGLFWLLVPYLDRRAGRGKSSPVFTAIGVLVVLYILVMTALTYLLPKF